MHCDECKHTHKDSVFSFPLVNWFVCLLIGKLALCKLGSSAIVASCSAFDGAGKLSVHLRLPDTGNALAASAPDDDDEHVTE